MVARSGGPVHGDPVTFLKGELIRVRGEGQTTTR